MNEKIKRYIIPVVVWCYTVVNICSPLMDRGGVSIVYAASSDSGSVIVKIKGEKVPPERITNLVAKPRLVSGIYPAEELGGRVELTWTAPKDPEVYEIHSDTYVFSYVIKYDTSTRGYDLGYIDQLWQWWDDAQKVFTNHIWEQPDQAKGQTFEVYPLGFGIPAPEEKYRLTYGITDKIIVTGLPKGEKIWIGISSRDRYYNQSTPTVVETYVPAGIEPPSRVTDLVATYGGIGTIQLSWTSPANDRYSLWSSSGLYNIPDGRYAIAYSTTLPETLELTPETVSSKWQNAQVVYIDTSTLCFVPQVYKITGLQLQQGTTSIGYYFLLWTSDEWNNKTNWSLRSNLAGYGLVAPDYVRNIVVYSTASVDPALGSYAVLSWINPKDEDIPLEGVKIYYSTTNYTTQENYFVKYTTTPNELVVTQHLQLLPRQWYYYVLLSFNSADSRPWTSDVIAKTYTAYDIIPPDKVTNLTGLADVSDQEGVYISLNWTLPDANLYQNKDFYIDGRIEVLYSTTSFVSDTTTKIYPPTVDNIKLTGLIPYVTYFISVITADGGNNKSTSTLTIYTPYDPYAPNPPKLMSYNIVASTDENIGTYVELNLRNSDDVDLKEIRVYYSTSGWVKNNYVTVTNTKPLAEYTTYVYQLYPRNTYYFIFVSYDVTNRFSYDVKEQIYVDKDILAPEVPSNIVLTADAKPESKPYGSYSRVTFSKPDTNKYRNFDLVGYEVYASSTNIIPYEDNNSVKVIISNIDQVYTELSNLEQHTTYYVTVHSVDVVGNKSTSTVYTVFTWKDLIPPKLPTVVFSTYSVSLDPAEGVKVKLLSFLPDEVDLDHVIPELSNEQTFSVIITSQVVPVKPRQQLELVYEKLDVETTYYFRTKLYDWSGNVSVSTLTYIIHLTPDDTVPLYPVSVKAEIKDNKLSLTWQPVVYQLNLTRNKLERFVGINNLGPQKPTTFELYKYKVVFKNKLTDDNEPWKELVSVTAEHNTCELPLNEGYYKILSYDITGNYDESVVVDNKLNYYIYKNGMYVKLTKNNGEKLAYEKLYHTVENYPEETSGRIIKVCSTKLGYVDEQQGKFIYSDYYKFDDENIIGVKYKVVNGKAKFVITNSKFVQTDKTVELDVDRIERQLAFYVFDGKEYVRATTYVDKENNVVYFKSRYLSKIQLRRVDISELEFNFVGVKPKIITPDSSPNENDVAFFIFNNPHGSEVKIRIFDINSVLVREIITNKDSSTPGSYINWDGKDFDGKFVQPGVYVYQIEAEGKKYKGTITVAR